MVTMSSSSHQPRSAPTLLNPPIKTSKASKTYKSHASSTSIITSTSPALRLLSTTEQTHLQNLLAILRSRDLLTREALQRNDSVPQIRLNLNNEVCAFLRRIVQRQDSHGANSHSAVGDLAGSLSSSISLSLPLWTDCEGDLVAVCAAEALAARGWGSSGGSGRVSTGGRSGAESGNPITFAEFSRRVRDVAATQAAIAGGGVDGERRSGSGSGSRSRNQDVTRMTDKGKGKGKGKGRSSAGRTGDDGLRGDAGREREVSVVSHGMDGVERMEYYGDGHDHMDVDGDGDGEMDGDDESGGISSAHKAIGDGDTEAGNAVRGGAKARATRIKARRKIWEDSDDEADLLDRL